MNFFEAWEKKAREKGDLSIGCDIGIHAAKQALKEMMAGEPIPMHLDVFGSWGKEPSTLLVDDNDEIHARWPGPQGTDGEEVVVMVFRDEKKD